MEKDEDEFWIQEEVVKMLLNQNYDVFRHYFIDLKEGKHPDTSIEEKANNIYKSYGQRDPFDEFVRKFQKGCKEKKEKRINKNEASTHSSQAVQTESNCLMEPSRLHSVEMDEYEIYKWSPHRRVSVVPPFRKRRRVPTPFNVVEFLVQKKKSDEVFPFKLQSDEDVQEVLFALETTEKKKMSLLADGVLRKIAEHVELLNQIYDYRILQVDYDH